LSHCPVTGGARRLLELDDHHHDTSGMHAHAISNFMTAPLMATPAPIIIDNNDSSSNVVSVCVPNARERALNPSLCRPFQSPSPSSRSSPSLPP
jgi:hypothetical protein